MDILVQVGKLVVINLFCFANVFDSYGFDS